MHVNVVCVHAYVCAITTFSLCIAANLSSICMQRGKTMLL